MIQKATVSLLLAVSLALTSQAMHMDALTSQAMDVDILKRPSSPSTTSGSDSDLSPRQPRFAMPGANRRRAWREAVEADQHTIRLADELLRAARAAASEHADAKDDLERAVANSSQALPVELNAFQQWELPKFRAIAKRNELEAREQEAREAKAVDEEAAIQSRTTPVVQHIEASMDTFRKAWQAAIDAKRVRKELEAYEQEARDAQAVHEQVAAQSRTAREVAQAAKERVQQAKLELERCQKVAAATAERKTESAKRLSKLLVPAAWASNWRGSAGS